MRDDRKPALDFDPVAIDAIFSNLDQCQYPGAAVGIAIDGVPVYRRGFGLANMELPLVLTPGIRMRIYSITKHFTCLAYLLLCEDGKAALDDPLRTYFPEFEAIGSGVTMRHVMANVSGLRDAFALSFHMCGTDWFAPGEEIVDLYARITDVEAPPGETWLYNSGGYVLLGKAVERLSGMSLGEFMRSRIFTPIGMHDTLLRISDDDFVPMSAAMHTSAGSGTFTKRSIGGDRGGSSGIASTVDDMLLWLRHMSAPRVGSAETWRLMTTPYLLRCGAATGYGYGLCRSDYRGIATLHHAGSGMGANAQMLKVESAGLDIVVLVNRDDVSSRDLALRIVDACLPDWAPPGASGGEPRIEGTYVSPTSGRTAWLHEQNGLQAIVLGGFGDVVLRPVADGKMAPLEDCILPFQLALNADESAGDHLALVDYGITDVLVRASSSPTVLVEEIIGEYYCSSGAFSLAVTAGGMRTSGPFGGADYFLAPLAEGIWSARSPSTETPFLTFLVRRDGEDLVLANQSTRGLRFQRSTLEAAASTTVGSMEVLA